MAMNQISNSGSKTSKSGFLLVIERGQTRFPRREITTDRFLIGAGSNCQLQLAGNIPLLHSIIISDGDALWIDAVSPEPPLLVNGQQIRDGRIERGDVVQIGEFVFSVDQKLPAAQSEVVEQPAIGTDQNIAATERTAEELLDLLTTKLAELEEFDTARRYGAGAMLQTAKASKASQSVPQVDWEQDPRAELLEMLSELHDRARALDAREVMLNEHARSLERLQEELRLQLEQLCRQTEGLEVPTDKTSPGDLELRRSA